MITQYNSTPAGCYSLEGDSPRNRLDVLRSAPWHWLCSRWFESTYADLANGYQQHLCAALDSMDSGRPINSI
nr:MAG TPA: hypothetical protein [Caudoviricetes sp.]